MLFKLYLKLKKQFDKIFKRGDYKPEAVKTSFQNYFRIALDKGNLSSVEIDTFCQMSDNYFNRFVIKKDGLTLDETELSEYIWTIAQSNGDYPTNAAIIEHLRDKYFPVSRTVN